MAPDADSEGEETLTGLLIVDPIPRRGKGPQGVWVYHRDERPIVLSYRPLHWLREFHERRVRVTGEFYEPTGQALLAPHFRVATVELVEGQKRRNLPEGKLAAPTWIEDAGDLAELDEEILEAAKFVEVHGRLSGVGDDFRTKARLELEDGTRITTRVTHRAPTGRVTVGGILSTGGEGWRLEGLAVCEGREPRCGVRDDRFVDERFNDEAGPRPDGG